MLKIDTKNNAKRLLLIAAVFIIAGILGMVIRGFNFGIDFVGGTIAQFEMHRTFETAEIKAVTDKYGEEKFAELVSEYAQSDCCDQAKLNENFSKLAKLGFSADSFDNAQKTDMSALTDGYCCYSIKLDEDSVNAADSPFYQAGAHIDNPTLNVYCFHTNGHVVPTHFALSDTDNIIGG